MIMIVICHFRWPASRWRRQTICVQSSWFSREESTSLWQYWRGQLLFTEPSSFWI